LDPLESLSADAGPLAVGSAVDESVAASCRALGVDHLPVLLLHRREHRKAWNGVAWQRLLELRASGTIGMLGVSVYDPEEALEALQDPDVQHLQLPMNLLDWRWRAKGVPPAVSSRPDVVVHARSAFLQGLLLSPPELWPETDYEREACLRTLGELVRRFGRDGVADLCLAYLRAQPWITSVVVGCETLAQLDQNLDLSRRQALTEEQCEEVVHSLPTAPEALLNPAKWKIAHAQPAA
jgi:aryl-alcohol dehydrogenase-like predicted oxidoreductase